MVNYYKVFSGDEYEAGSELARIECQILGSKRSKIIAGRLYDIDSVGTACITKYVNDGSWYDDDLYVYNLAIALFRKLTIMSI